MAQAGTFERELALAADIAPSVEAAVPGIDVLAVEQGGKRWTWVRRQIGVQQGEALFHEARSYFLEVYNSSMAFRGTDPNARPDFAGERERAQQSGGAAKDKLQRLGGRQQ